MKKKIYAIFLGIFALSLAGSVYAAETILPGKGESDVVVGTSQTHKNLYVAGSNVTVNGATQGDLTALGGMVSVEGDVEQDILVIGGNLNINSSVGGDIRIGGGNITINGPVAGDVVSAGGNISFSPKSSVNGDVMVTGGSVVINGPVKGQLKIFAGSVTINSKIEGSVYVQASQGLTFGSSAEVAGVVDYKGPRQSIVRDGAKVGTVNFTEWQGKQHKNFARAILTIGFLIKLVAWILAAWLLAHFKKSWVMGAWSQVQEKPWSSLGWGLVYMIVPVILAILLLVVMVGYYGSLVIGLAYILALVLAKILGGIIMGYYVLKYLTKSNEEIPLWQPILIGTVLWSLLGFVPVVGWLVVAIVYLQTLGALVNVLKNNLKE